ncbi:putative quinol monooxygenase [Desulfovibrio inopinatus]|uniref:putative quinol monooxygenase n=1 Tax=Desulfovibrio inopinatus TaxID=102109 RepID=UPI0004179ED1|nr:putative quinol monooxygenase [Desulfovibrio inopinatus]
MFAVVAKVKSKPEHRQAVIDALIGDGKGSVENEAGCVMFHVVQDHEDKDLFHLFEIYKDAEAFEVHKNAPHFVKCFGELDGLLVGGLTVATADTIFP